MLREEAGWERAGGGHPLSWALQKEVPQGPPPALISQNSHGAGDKHLPPLRGPESTPRVLWCSLSREQVAASGKRQEADKWLCVSPHPLSQPAAPGNNVLKGKGCLSHYMRRQSPCRTPTDESISLVTPSPPCPGPGVKLTMNWKYTGWGQEARKSGDR